MPTKAIEFSKESFLKEEFNPAWTVARAWCDLMAQRHNVGNSGLIHDDDAYRLAVIRSQEFPRLLVRAALAFDPSELANYTLHLCKQVLAEPPEMRRNKLMQSLLTTCLTVWHCCRLHRDIPG